VLGGRGRMGDIGERCGRIQCGEIQVKSIHLLLWVFHRVTATSKVSVCYELVQALERLLNDARHVELHCKLGGERGRVGEQWGRGRRWCPWSRGMARGSEVRRIARFEDCNEQEEILRALWMSGLCKRDLELHLEGQGYRKKYIHI